MSKVQDNGRLTESVSVALPGDWAPPARFRKRVLPSVGLRGIRETIRYQRGFRCLHRMPRINARASGCALNARIHCAPYDFRLSTLDLRLSPRMSSIRRFEDVLGWQRARELAREIYRASASGAFAKDYALRDQIRRASVSVLSNISEGFERGSDREFAQFLNIAKGSVGEVRCQLYIALDQGYLPEAQFRDLSNKAAEISRQIF